VAPQEAREGRLVLGREALEARAGSFVVVRLRHDRQMSEINLAICMWLQSGEIN